MSYTCFDLEVTDGVAHLQFSRPEAFNSMNREFWQEFPEAIRTLDDLGEARVIVISSTGRHFRLRTPVRSRERQCPLFCLYRARPRVQNGPLKFLSAQFGRPIGSYQAIKHKCADMLVEVEFLKSAAYAACFGAADGAEDLLEMAALAKFYSSETYFHAAAENIQIHGGMGFTWELPCHLYFKRAKSSELLLGDAAHHREILAALIQV